MITVVHLSLFVHQKIQMGFLFYNLKKKLTIKLFKYLREMALRSSNEKKNASSFFVNINVNENAF